MLVIASFLAMTRHNASQTDRASRSPAGTVHPLLVLWLTVCNETGEGMKEATVGK